MQGGSRGPAAGPAGRGVGGRSGRGGGSGRHEAPRPRLRLQPDHPIGAVHVPWPGGIGHSRRQRRTAAARARACARGGGQQPPPECSAQRAAGAARPNQPGPRLPAAQQAGRPPHTAAGLHRCGSRGVPRHGGAGACAAARRALLRRAADAQRTRARRLPHPVRAGHTTRGTRWNVEYSNSTIVTPPVSGAGRDCNAGPHVGAGRDCPSPVPPGRPPRRQPGDFACAAARGSFDFKRGVPASSVAWLGSVPAGVHPHPPPHPTPPRTYTHTPLSPPHPALLQYDIDGNRAAFSAQERANIIAIWRAVAEDFAPFAVRPARAARPGAAAAPSGQQAPTTSKAQALAGAGRSFGSRSARLPSGRQSPWKSGMSQRGRRSPCAIFCATPGRTSRAPLQVDITTEETDSRGQPLDLRGRGGRVVIGGSSLDWTPDEAGGLSYINSFGQPYSQASDASARPPRRVRVLRAVARVERRGPVPSARASATAGVAWVPLQHRVAWRAAAHRSKDALHCTARNPCPAG